MTGHEDGYVIRNDTFIYALTSDGSYQKVFGKGIASLLEKTRETGSVNEACRDLGISYSKAMKIIKRAEQMIQVVLLERRKGGSDREGSKLTRDADKLLSLFRELEAENKKVAAANGGKFIDGLEQIRKSQSNNNGREI
ncbi:MAG TPA: hypothetical protein DCO86_03660 [Spirochaetaceae bacterium]|nr:hypothetical protein [Spirochaetaceae bacterium]